MAIKGCEGYIKVGANTISEVREWTLTEVAEIIDVSVLGSCSRQKIVGIKSGSGSLTAYLDESENDTENKARGVFIPGATVAMELYPTGEAVEAPVNTKITFDALISEVGVSTSAEGMVEMSISFETSGVITWGVIG